MVNANIGIVLLEYLKKVIPVPYTLLCAWKYEHMLPHNAHFSWQISFKKSAKKMYAKFVIFVAYV